MWLVTVALAAASLLGCSFVNSLGPSSCDRSEGSNEPIRYTEGDVDAHGTYQSSPADGELLYFPGGMRYRIEHQLGEVPTWWELQLSFDQFGIEGGGTLDQLQAEALLGRRLNSRAMPLHPLQSDAPARHLFNLPGDVQASLRLCQGAILGRVGGQLMQR